MKQRGRRFWVGLVGSSLLLGAICSAVHAADISVPLQQPTIQGAIDAAANGDIIRVAPGTYQEDIDFKGKAVTLVGTGGAGVTTLVGTGQYDVLRFQTGEGRNTVVSGFTFQTAPASPRWLVNTQGASPTLTDNVFETDVGSAIQAVSSSMLLQRNLFRDAQCRLGVAFATVWFTNASSPSIKNNVFSNNKCTALFLDLAAGMSADVANNTFVGNSCAIKLAPQTDGHLQLFRNNLIYLNQNGFYEDFDLTAPAPAPTFQNNLVYGNATNFLRVTDFTGTSGNISADPRLGDAPVYDVHPGQGSPAIDAGLNAALGDAGSLDYYHGQRIRTGSSGQAVVDIGAAEYVGPEPIISLQASATALPLGSAYTLNWSASNATSCSADGAWSGALALSGSRTFTPAAGTMTYSVVCTNANASRTKSTILTVYPPPTITLTVSPTEIPVTDDATVQWSTSLATACVKSGAWSGAADTSGSQLVHLPAGTYTYTLACIGAGGSSTASAQLVVHPLPTINARLNQYNISTGQTTIFTWSTTNVDYCLPSGILGQAPPVLPANGSMTLGPFDVGPYALGIDCFGGGGIASSNQLLNVFAPPTDTATHSYPLPSPTVVATSKAGQAAAGSGLDGHGYAYFTGLPTPSVSWSGQTFDLGVVGQATAITKVTIPLPATSLLSLNLLATGLNGNQLSQSFIVTYTDGTKTVYTQSLSDWGHAQAFSGESVALVCPSRIGPTGSSQPGAWNLYGYRFGLDPTKTPLSLTLPGNRNVAVLAINLTAPAVATPLTLTASFNVYSIWNPGSPPKNGGFDGHGWAYYSGTFPPYVTWPGNIFNFGAPNQPNGVAKGTISLLPKATTALAIFASGVNGAQPDQRFVVTYADGSTATFQQSVSDWGHPQGYAGETAAITAFRVKPTGHTDPTSETWKIYGYTFRTDASKTIKSLTLPNNRNVIILAVDQSTAF